MIIYTKRESGQAVNIQHKGDDYVLVEGEFSIDEAEITEDLVKSLNSDSYNAFVDSQEYARKRASAFPSIGDQLDMQYWDQVNGTTTWKDAIAKVKADNPKEAE